MLVWSHLPKPLLVFVKGNFQIFLLLTVGIVFPLLLREYLELIKKKNKLSFKFLFQELLEIMSVEDDSMQMIVCCPDRKVVLYRYRLFFSNFAILYNSQRRKLNSYLEFIFKNVSYFRFTILSSLDKPVNMLFPASCCLGVW